jgi:hypothetical protein
MFHLFKFSSDKFPLRDFPEFVLRQAWAANGNCPGRGGLMHSICPEGGGLCSLQNVIIY